ncbi:MAG: hypothetical protein R2880_15230 [Deinococcales bacterium]
MRTVFDSLTARIYTSDFRVYGHMHLPPNQESAWHLNRSDRIFLPLTEAIVYRAGFSHPPSEAEFRASVAFITIPLSKILWVVGGRCAEIHEDQSTREVYVLYPDYFLKGELRMAKNVRLSSHLSEISYPKNFQTLYNVSLGIANKDQLLKDTPSLEFFDFATVNMANVGGVFDLSMDNP